MTPSHLRARLAMPLGLLAIPPLLRAQIVILTPLVSLNASSKRVLRRIFADQVLGLLNRSLRYHARAI